MTLAAVGTMIGPGYSGLLVEPLGTGWTFGVAGAIGLAAALGLAFTPATREVHEVRHHEPVAQTVRRMVREPLVLGGLVCIALPGLVNNGVNLLVPLQLDDNGTSTAVVGACFSASALIFAAGSFAFARSGMRFASLRVGAAGALVLAAVLLIPLLTTASIPLLVFIVVRSVANTGLFPLAMPLAVQGAERAGIGRGAVLGIVNASWALAATIGPILAGAIADAAGRAHRVRGRHRARRRRRGLARPRPSTCGRKRLDCRSPCRSMCSSRSSVWSAPSPGSPTATTPTPARRWRSP